MAQERLEHDDLPRVLLVGLTRHLFQRYLNHYNAEQAKRKVAPFTESDTYFRFQDNRSPFTISSVGSEEISIDSLRLRPIRYGGSVFELSVRLFADSSPFVADGDILDTASGMAPENYLILISEDIPLVLVQEVQVGDRSRGFSREQLARANTHPIANAECRAIRPILAHELTPLPARSFQH